MLKKLKSNTAPDPDDISPCLLKELATQLAPVLTRMFQTSIDSGIVSTQWKYTNLSPIFKKENCSKALNYRPVTLTAVCCKLNEHIIAKAIMNHLESNGILTDTQYGF